MKSFADSLAPIQLDTFSRSFHNRLTSYMGNPTDENRHLAYMAEQALVQQLIRTPSEDHFKRYMRDLDDLAFWDKRTDVAA